MSKNLKALTYSALLMAAAFLLPFLTGSNPSLGNVFCPMHIPVFLCGIICGPLWGGAVGFVTPLLRSFIVGAPPFPANAVPMAFELLVYAVAVGVLYRLFPKKLPYIYLSLISAMVLGRAALAVSKFFVLGLEGTSFGLKPFLVSSVLPSWVGIVIQLALIPPIVYALKRAKLFPED